MSSTSDRPGFRTFLASQSVLIKHGRPSTPNLAQKICLNTCICNVEAPFSVRADAKSAKEVLEGKTRVRRFQTTQFNRKNLKEEARHPS
jgi:hypothetical protein